MGIDTSTFKVDMEHLQKVQRTIRKAGNIFPNEQKLVNTLEETVNKAQSDESLNLYYNMAQYLKQRLNEVKQHLEMPQSGVEQAIEDLTWSIHYLQWLVAEQQPQQDQ